MEPVGSLNMSRFEWIYNSDKSSDVAWDKDLTPNEQFATIPTVGAMFEGWVLQIPRRPCLNYALLEVPQRIQAISEAKHVAEKLRTMTGRRNVFAFEHGAMQPMSPTGCGVDQAHLHIIATDLDLFSAVECDFDWKSVDIYNAWDSIDYEYLLLTDFQKTISHRLYSTVSQYFRKKIAILLNATDRWDYREFPEYELAISTSTKFRACH